MIRIFQARGWVFLCCGVAATFAWSAPLLAGNASPAVTSSAPAPAQKSTTRVAPEPRYCIKEAVNSRILRTYCKSAKEWENAGSPLDRKD